MATMTPFERAMKIHEDRYGAMAADARHWRWATFGLVGLLTVCVVAMGTMTLRSRVTPYVVQVDEHGYEILIGPAEEANPADDRIVIAHLGRFVRDHRTVLSETHAQEALIRRVMAMVAAGSPAEAKATAFYQALAEEPTGQRDSVDCEVKSVLPMAQDSWQVDWAERRYESGRLVETRSFKAVVTVDIEPTRSLSQVLQNPLGIYVVDFHVTEVG